MATLTSPVVGYPLAEAYGNPVTFTADTDETIDRSLYWWEYRHSGTKAVGAQENTPLAIDFHPEGHKMFVSGNQYEYVFEYDLTRPWDASSASYSSNSADMTQNSNSVYDMSFSSDGTAVYALDHTAQLVYQYTCSTAWDMSDTVSYASKSLDTSGETSTPLSFCFGDSGGKVYVLDYPAGVVYQYTCSTAWDIGTASYASKSKDISAQDSLMRTIRLSPDGTTLLAYGTTNDAVFQYTLGTAYDISTASYASKSLAQPAVMGTTGHALCVGNDGRSIYLCEYNTQDTIYQMYVPGAWDLSDGFFDSNYPLFGHDTGAQSNAPYDVAWKPDGTTFYVFETAADLVLEYACSTAWNIGTASYTDSYNVGATSGADTIAFAFGDSGSKMYAMGSTDYSGGDIFQFTLSTPWDVSTSSSASKSFDVQQVYNEPEDFALSADGTKMYLLELESDTIRQYTLSTAWDISTASYASKNLSVSGNAKRIEFTPSGDGLYVTNSIDDTLTYYYLTTSWDISTATSAEVVLDADDFGVALYGGIWGNADGDRLYHVNAGDVVEEWIRSAPPSDLDSMATLLHAVTYKMSGTVTDDTYDLSIRVVCGAKILAADDSGGTFATVASSITTTTYTTSSETAFSYVNTSATRSDWLNAKIELKQDWTQGGAGGTPCPSRSTESPSRAHTRWHPPTSASSSSASPCPRSRR